MLTGSNPLAQIVAGTEGDDVLTIGGGENTYNGLGGADRFVFAVGPITSVPSSATIDGGAGVDLFDVVGTWRQTYTHTNFNSGLISTVIPAPYMLTAGPGGAVRFSADLDRRRTGRSGHVEKHNHRRRLDRGDAALPHEWKNACSFGRSASGYAGGGQHKLCRDCRCALVAG